MASTAADAFLDFLRRRTGLVEALTTEKDCLCLYVDADNVSWDVTFPPLDAPPPELHKAAQGLIFERDKGIPLSDWLFQIALQCDTWLKSVASHRGVRLDRAERQLTVPLLNYQFPIF
ncbi:hypothetical protein Syun_016844 [Stephania yunnanensis]|uniref:PHD finger protein ALFIN-LIKE n=1 Tax=Stephania yunnanensis TaxID=152371 RepID=A0AAP0P1U8_9MAGN